MIPFSNRDNFILVFRLLLLLLDLCLAFCSLFSTWLMPLLDFSSSFFFFCLILFNWIFSCVIFEYLMSFLATSFEELTHWKRLWCWEGLGAGGEGDGRGWDGWMASPTRWTWVWVNSRSWWWTGRPGVLQFMGWQRVRYDWATELNWTEWVFTL